MLRKILGTALAVLLATAMPLQAADKAGWIKGLLDSRQNQTAQRLTGTALTATPRIIGGTQAKPGAWPFVVALVDATEPNNYQAQFCGGTLISQIWVLTASHCVDGLAAADLQILVGTQNLSTGGTRISVSRIIMHPRYDSVTTDYDVALVQLATVAPVNATIPMLRSKQSARADAGDRATVVGWGDTTGNATYPAALRQVTVPIVSQTVCNAPNAYGGTITARMLCAGLASGGKDSCGGDSGGPLLIPAGSGWIQAGIVSFGIGCALPNKYGVYTRLSALSGWVKIMQSSIRSSGPRCKTGPGASADSCLSAAVSDASTRLRNLIVDIADEASPEQAKAARASEAAWRSALPGICAYDRATGGETGRLRCELRETQKRIEDLSDGLGTVAN